MRQIDQMSIAEIQTLRDKGMLTDPRRNIDRKRVEIQVMRIDACDTLLDYLHDDVPHYRQEPFKSVIEKLQRNLRDEMEDGLSE